MRTSYSSLNSNAFCVLQLIKVTTNHLSKMKFITLVMRDFNSLMRTVQMKTEHLRVNGVMTYGMYTWHQYLFVFLYPALYHHKWTMDHIHYQLEIHLCFKMLLITLAILGKLDSFPIKFLVGLGYLLGWKLFSTPHFKATFYVLIICLTGIKIHCKYLCSEIKV